MTTIIITALVALGAGIGIGRVLLNKANNKQREEAEKEAQRILTDAQLKAESVRKEKELQAKERFLSPCRARR